MRPHSDLVPRVDAQGISRRAAIASGEFVQVHEDYGRNCPAAEAGA